MACEYLKHNWKLLLENEDLNTEYLPGSDQGTLGMEVNRKSFDISSSTRGNEEPVSIVWP